MQFLSETYYQKSTQRFLFLLGICLISRVLTAIYYLEDIDSMRFALSLLEFDVTKAQPHFPAYPVFCFLGQGLYMLTGSFGLTFALIGGFSIAIIIHYGLQLVNSNPSTKVLFAILIFLNPLLWLMSNRYMPDIFGLALSVMALSYFKDWMINREKSKVIGFFVLAALLLGTRLSYFPVILIPGVYMFVKDIRRWPVILVCSIGTTLIWLIPLILITGWNNLIEAGQLQTSGHFNEFGGTIITDGSIVERFIRLMTYTWADGMNGYVEGRNLFLVATSLTWALLFGLSVYRILNSRDYKQKINLIVVFSFLTYLLWILFFQNVMYKTRHIIPLLPLLFVVLANSMTTIKKNWARQIIILSFAVIQGVATIKIVSQHKNATAIARTAEYIKGKKGVLSAPPLLKKYFLVGGFEEDSTNGMIFHVSFRKADITCRQLADTIFYHNPYVNRMWPEIRLTTSSCDE